MRSIHLAGPTIYCRTSLCPILPVLFLTGRDARIQITTPGRSVFLVRPSLFVVALGPRSSRIAWFWCPTYPTGTGASRQIRVWPLSQFWCWEVRRRMILDKKKKEDKKEDTEKKRYDVTHFTHSSPAEKKKKEKKRPLARIQSHYRVHRVHTRTVDTAQPRGDSSCFRPLAGSRSNVVEQTYYSPEIQRLFFNCSRRRARERGFGYAYSV